MDETYTIIDAPKRGRFERREVIDIAVAVMVLSVAFMVLYRNGSIMDYLGYHHKFVAQNSGMRSEFRMWPAGLGITLITSLFGFLFAAPGAVVIHGCPDKRTNGRISIAGPAVNIVLCAVGIAGCLVFNYSAWVLFFMLLASLNAFLAFFNLLPIPPLDGSKIVTWNIPVYVIALAAAIIELAYLYLWMPDLYFVY